MTGRDCWGGGLGKVECWSCVGGGGGGRIEVQCKGKRFLSTEYKPSFLPHLFKSVS